MKLPVCRISFVFALVVGMVCAIFSGSIPYKKWHSENRKWSFDPIVVQQPSNSERIEFKKWANEKGIKPNYFTIKDNSAPSARLLPTLLGSRDFFLKQHYWQNISKLELVGVITLYSSVGFLTSFFSTMVIYGIIAYVIRKNKLFLI
jgi:hypothetical protein